jgi:hypothetical protein
MGVHYNGWSLKLKNESRPLSGHLSPIHNALPSSSAELLIYASDLWPMKQCLWVMAANIFDAQSYWGARSATLYAHYSYEYAVLPCVRDPTAQPFKVQWLLYIPPGLTFSNSVFCPHSVLLCLVCFSEQTAIISLDSINRLGFTTETLCVYCAVRNWIYKYNKDLGSNRGLSMTGQRLTAIKDENECELYLNIRFVPRSKHAPSRLCNSIS